MEIRKTHTNEVGIRNIFIVMFKSELAIGHRLQAISFQSDSPGHSPRLKQATSNEQQAL